MKKIILSVLLVAANLLPGLAQRFAQYHTGTLYDSFENPSQSAFIADTTKNFALSLLTNLNLNAYLTGNAQTTVKSRFFTGQYNNNAITVGQNQSNNVLVQSNVYLAMFKMFATLSGRIEIGASYQIRANARGHITDETIALFNGSQAFTQDRYTDIFNSKAFYESFHQLSITYKEKVTRNFTVGAKLSTLLGIDYNKLNINQSDIVFNRGQDNADWLLKGTYQATYVEGRYPKRDLLPSLSNPGLAIGLGATYIAPGGVIIQGNIKDLGFIRWSRRAVTYEFGTQGIPARINNLSSSQRENNVNDALARLVQTNPQSYAFVKPIVGRAEVAVAKKFQFGSVIYQPTAVVSQQLYGQGAAAALVNQVSFGNFSATLSGIINEDQKFDTGLQFMYKKPNFEVFAGSEQLGNTFNLYSAYNDNNSAITSARSHSGASIYFGFSFKLGKLIERWKGESYYPDGSEQGPLGKKWNNWFNH